MTSTIEAVLFDMGGTLRRTIRRGEEEKRHKVVQILRLLGSDLLPAELVHLLSDRLAAYKQWAEETEVELNEVDLWTRWMLPDFPAELVTRLAVQLNDIWRDAVNHYGVLPETKEVILTLFRRGYRLGLISNTTSSVEVPRTFAELEISGCFEVVILSCVLGKRKPNPETLLSATKRMGIKPEKCVYVGDRPGRDVKASRSAGFASSIIISDTLTLDNFSDEPSLKPDHIIRNLKELHTLFPARHEPQKDTHPGGNGKVPGDSPLYNVSLSTTWAFHNFPALEDFFRMANRLGFANLELNHQVNSEMLAGIDLSRYHFSSIHEPCPANTHADTMKVQDWLISSTDEERRTLGVNAILNSIRMASDLGARVVVIHPGMVISDWSDEELLANLFNSGQVNSQEYRNTKMRLIDSRAALVKPHLKAVKKSLLELLEFSEPLGICLGLENRYHFKEIPVLDELEELLSLASPDRIGFWYDVGHAQALDRLGFFLHEDWLKRYGSRISGVHLHDVVGISDHRPPGQGEIDFDKVVGYIPADAIRTFELKPRSASPEQVKDSLHFLAEKGFLKCL